MLATQSGLDRLNEEWQKAGSPQAWEMVVQEEVNQNTVLNSYCIRTGTTRAVSDARPGDGPGTVKLILTLQRSNLRY